MTLRSLGTKIKGRVFQVYKGWRESCGTRTAWGSASFFADHATETV